MALLIFSCLLILSFSLHAKEARKNKEPEEPSLEAPYIFSPENQLFPHE